MNKHIFDSLYCERPGYEKGYWNKNKIQEMATGYIENCLNKLYIQCKNIPSNDEWNLKFTIDKIDELKKELQNRGEVK